MAKKKAAAKKAVKKAVKKVAASRAIVKKAAPLKQPGIVGHIRTTDGGCLTCTWGFDSSAIDISKTMPRKVIATVTKSGGHWPDGTPVLSFKLTEPK